MGKEARRKRERRERRERDRQPQQRSAVGGPVHIGPPPDSGFEPSTVNGKLAYQFIPDDNGDLHMEVLPLPRKTAMGTPMLVNLSSIAREQSWCSKALDDATLRRLDPTGHHLILLAWKHTTEDWKRENVRAHMMLKLRGQAEPYNAMVDLPSRQFGVFLGLHQTRSARHVEGVLLPEGWAEIYEKPNWAAARSFPKVWDDCAEMFKLSAERQLSGDLLHTEFLRQGYSEQQAAEWVRVARSPRAVFGATALNSLGVAKLIVAETEWAQAIDDKRPDQATLTRFTETCRLPFDTIYLDFEGPGGNRVSVPVEGLDGLMGVAKLAGAVMYREAADGPLHIIPIATPRDRDGNYEPCGRVVMHADDAAADVGLASIFIDGDDSGIRMAVVRPGAVDEDAAPGRIELPYPEPERLVDDPEMAKQFARFVHAAAMRALRVLYMLQGGNVELVEAKLHREGKRLLQRSEKRGWPVDIGLMVAVRWKKKLYYRPPGAERMESEGNGYSHAFWVQGHPAYYPLGTRIADAMAETDPEGLVVDPTPEKIGVFRMVWRMPYVKGLYDPDTGVEREPVEKTRKITGGLPDDPSQNNTT
jgi:hypothetical protein